MTSFRVVVVDDTQANLLLLANIIQDAGYEVRVANSAQRALTLIERQPPDLVLLDINLPDKDGYTVCRELKAKPALQAIPVIFLSAHDDAAARGRAFEVGGAEYMTKPFDASEVLVKVALHLKLAALQREVQARRADLSHWQARAEATFAALCATLRGAVFDSRYQLGTMISGGSHGAVFDARDLTSEQEVSIRVLPPTARLCARLTGLRDAPVHSVSVHHQNIASPIGYGVSQSLGIPYFVLAPHQGLTLRERLDRHPRLGIEEARGVMGRLAEALASAHAAGGVHGDLRPESVFLGGGDVGTDVSLLDFGIVEIEDGTLHNRYRAPERQKGRPLDAAGDVYALGVMMHEVFGGEAPPEVKDIFTRAQDPEPGNRPSAAQMSGVLSSPPH